MASSQFRKLCRRIALGNPTISLPQQAWVDIQRIYCGGCLFDYFGKVELYRLTGLEEFDDNERPVTRTCFSYLVTPDRRFAMLTNHLTGWTYVKAGKQRFKQHGLRREFGPILSASAQECPLAQYANRQALIDSIEQHCIDPMSKLRKVLLGMVAKGSIVAAWDAILTRGAAGSDSIDGVSMICSSDARCRVVIDAEQVCHLQVDGHAWRQAFGQNCPVVPEPVDEGADVRYGKAQKDFWDTAEFDGPEDLELSLGMKSLTEALLGPASGSYSPTDAYV